MKTLTPDAPIEKINRAYVSGEAFDILGVHPAMGGFFSKDDDRISQGRALAVISYDFWDRRFQRDPTVVGRKIVIENKELEIIGVTNQGFWGVEPGKFVDVWLPGTLFAPYALRNPGAYWLQIIGRFAAGVSPEQVQAHLQPPFHDFQAQLVKLFPTMPDFIKKQFLQSKIRVHSAATGVSDLRKNFLRPLWILFGVAAGILLMACANVASLLLARSTARGSEMAMRVALGAARMRLIRQMLTESIILSLMAGALGWLLARSAGPLLVRLLSTNRDPLQLALAIDTRVLFFCIAVSALSAVFFGLVPAWQASGVQPVPAIVNEAFARKYFNSANPVGREFSHVSRIDHSSPRQIIIGVVADTRYYNLRTPAVPIAYLPINGNTVFTLYVRSPLALDQIMRIVEDEASRFGSGMQIHEVTNLETIVGNTLLREKLLAGMGGAFAFFGLLLAGIGLFGLVNYSVGRRTKEIGIRMALGARRTEIVSLVLKDVTALMGVGIIIGLAAGLGVLGVVKSLLFGIKTADPFVTGTAIGLLLLTGFLAASLPAHRAATVDPMLALREE